MYNSEFNQGCCIGDPYRMSTEQLRNAIRNGNQAQLAKAVRKRSNTTCQDCLNVDLGIVVGLYSGVLRLGDDVAAIKHALA